MTKSEAFAFLDRLARGIALIFGENCETIIHDFSDGTMINVAIYNNSVSGRESWFSQRYSRRFSG